MIKKRLFSGLGVLILALVICIGSFFQRKEYYASLEKKSVKEEVEEEDNNYFADVWLTYWGTGEAKAELDLVADSVQDICYFAAYYDEEGNPFVEDSTLKLFKEYSSDSRFNNKNYLTFVNDVRLNDGSAISKDIALLEDFFKTDFSMQQCAKKMVELAVAEGFDGVEVDFEALGNEDEIWHSYVDFVAYLYQITQESSLDLRIVLEPSFRLKGFCWPNGPEYVVMCYNLHGKTTEAGDRANKEFLLELVDKMEQMPGEPNFALATGGYDFKADGTVVGVTAKEAEELFMKTPGEAPMRDENSGQLYFGYIDDEDVIHYVWYSDIDTIKYWMDVIKSTGHDNFTIFKVGGTL